MPYDILAEYGHTHDHAEAATLLRSETKKILSPPWPRCGRPNCICARARRLRQRPTKSCAGFIKRVQQSTRICCRVGLELPPVDESRRLSGERADLRDPRGALVAASRSSRTVDAYLVQAGGLPEFEALEAWLRERRKAPPRRARPGRRGRRAEARTGLRELQAAIAGSTTWAGLADTGSGDPAAREPDPAGRQYLDILAGEAQP
ncbi:MAG: hypothetical protein R3F08_04175 [Dokdonella sp.]